MRCVQREAGAPGLAPTPSTGSPSRAEARSAGGACFRRHLLALLLAVPGLFTGAPGLVVAPTALLLGALSLLAPAPAAADVLVSNIGQAGTTNAFTFLNSSRAQGFTTGSNTGGYTLESIESQMDVLGTLNILTIRTIRAQLWSATSSGTPSVKVADLTVPSSITDGPVTFTAPQDTRLNANTTYFFVIFTTGSVTSLTLPYTLSADEDAGAATGWSIGNTSYYQSRNVPQAGSWTTSTRAARIRVNGANFTPPAGCADEPGNNAGGREAEAELDGGDGGDGDGDGV